MQSLSETPTWVMNWQLFLNNPNIDKWKRLRVKKSKLFTEQRQIYRQPGRNPFRTAAKIQVWADQKSRRSEQMQQIFVFVIRNIFPCGFYSISETKGPSTTNNWGDNAGLWGSESLSAWSNILWSALVYGKFPVPYFCWNWNWNCAILKIVNQDAEPLDVGVPLQRKWKKLKVLTDANGRQRDSALRNSKILWKKFKDWKPF